MASSYEQTARVFRALGDENRLRILELLRSGEKCACELLEDLRISQPTLSHHMKFLCDAGVVKGRREGKWVHYSIEAEAAKEITEAFRQQFSPEDRR